MEGLIFILLIAIFAFFGLGYGKKQNKPVLSESDESKELPRRGMRRFERATAFPQPEKPILRGSAYVVDGDTIIIRKTQIRLFGIDAPEINHPYGQKAKWAMVSLCKGQQISAEITEKDAYGRTVAHCYLEDGRDLSAELVKLGLAIDWPKFSGGKYRELEVPDVRKKLWLADARQKGRIHVWEQFEAKQKARGQDKKL